MKTLIEIYKDFTEYPGLRYCDLSDKSGEEFYHELLNTHFYECFSKGKTLTVDLDYTGGYASSFLDEAFGNLVFDYGRKNVVNYLDIISNEEPHWKDMLLNKTFVEWDNRRKENKPPKVTKIHREWYKVINDNIKKGVWLNPDV